ncbi:MAG TPA: cadherin domain-containing protein, partial [Phycisphaerae bacterium]|nr:cadherin domain-containing protein [Phycisphaerae bacterium]
DATFAVNEDAANGTDVGTPLAVTDPDAGDTTAWTITAGNGDGVFAIDADTGQITVTDNTTLDHETTPQYVLTVRVTDSGGLWDEAAVTVNVGDVNETPDIGDATFGVDEDAANGTDVGAPLAVTDPDAGDTTAWAITAGNSGGVFAIDADTGQLTVTDNTNLDFETTPQYVLTVRVTDSGGLWDEAAVTVNVGDVNETPDIGDATFAVDEDAANGTDVGAPLPVTDPDAGDTTAWTITAGNGDGVFAIDADTGQLTVTDNTTLDHETTPQYVLTVRVTDSGGLWDEAAVTVNVGDVNETPDIGDATFAVDEDAANGTNVGAPLAVTDPDAGDTTAWSITGGNGDGVFAIDLGTGQITVTDNTTLDFETTPQYVLTVRVTDSGGLWDEAAVTVDVGDVNETPDIGDATFAVDEDAANGTNVGAPLAVTDPDAGDTTAWTITGGNGDGVFAIDAGTGQITVTDNSSLDFETTPQYVLTVRVTDSGGLWDEAAVTVNVGDVAEPPTVGAGQTFNVDEDAANGTSVGTVQATDPENNIATYEITAGNGAGVFAIDAGTGQITVTDNTTLDFETTPQYVLTVRVTDSGGLWDEAGVTVNVSDVNETPTVNAQAFSVAENSALGTAVDVVVASDPDAGDSLTYAITAGNTGSAFAINGTTGQVTVNNVAALDFETNPTFALTVEVTDTGALSDSATVTVNVTDVNEAPDVDAQIFSTPETSEDGTIVGTVVASDPDPGDTLGYAITGGTGVGIFAVDPVSGQITVLDASALDYESGTTSYTLLVEVSDDGAPALSDTATITIAVNDVAEGTGGGGAPQSSSAAAAWAPTITRPTSSLPAISMPTLGARIPLGPTAGRAGGEASSSVADAEPADDEPADAVAVAEPGPEGGARTAQDERDDARAPAPAREPADGTATAGVTRAVRAADPPPMQGDLPARPPAAEPVTVADSKPADEDGTDDSPSAPARVADARPASDKPADAGATTRETATDPAPVSWHNLDATLSQVEDLAAEPSGYPRLAAGTACGLSAAATAACAVWYAKGAFFTQAALSCMPLWRWVDPMPVLQARKGKAARRSKRRKA